MSISTRIELMNAALVRVGSEPILSEDDDSTRARTVKTEYHLQLEYLTRSHPWRHATAYTSLNQITPKPADVFDFHHVFQLPTDCLRVISTDLDPLAEWTEIEGRRIAANTPAMRVKFIRLVTDVSKFSANFKEALAWLIARNIAPGLSSSTERARLCHEMFDSTLETARTFDAQVGNLERLAGDDIWSRRGRRY